MPSPSRRLARALALVAGSATALLGVAVPALATPPPAPVTNLAATLGAHGLDLTWTASGAGAPIVRDVTGESGPAYDPSGPALVPSPTAACPASTCLYDGTFANTSARTYAVWATDDGTAATAAATPAVQAFGPLPALPTAVTLTASATRVVYNQPVTFSGTVTRAGLPLPGATVKLVGKVLGGAGLDTLRTLTAASDGSVRVTYTPLRSRSYQLRFEGDAFSGPSASALRTVLLAPRVVLKMDPSIVQWKQTATLKGAVGPGFPGKAMTVQRWTGSSWLTVAHPVLTSASTFSVPLRMAIGKYTYRAVLPSAADHLSGVSPSATLAVIARTLVQGNSGPDVLSMERRLAALHYDVGAVDGYFDYSTRHGVTAFQKVEGMPRTGQWSATERVRVLHPRGFRLRYHDSRLTAEVDITRQVMVLARNGVIITIVDVSTGSEKPYYQDGVKYIAHTPRGVFSIFHKIDGIRVSKLGELYRPSYFYKGWAIHGSGSVPTYPASHGCVRITNPVADRLFAKLVIGTRVAVYDE